MEKLKKPREKLAEKTKKTNIKTILVITIILLAILTRLIALNIRPLHHDEGVNYHFTKKILAEGIFKYDPTNYHGPSYFLTIALSFALLGISEFSLRLPAAIFGILLVLIPLLFNKPKNKFTASLFLILSPSLMYYSRYSIHESLFVLSTLVSLYTFSQIIEKNSLKSLPLFAASLAIAFTTKETISISIISLLILTIINHKKIRNLKIENQKNTILISIIIFLLIYITLFTSFFTNSNGIADSIKGYFPWLNRGFTEHGHAKPFYYYFQLMLKYELPLLLLALLAIPKAFKTKNLFAKNLSLWFLANLIIYSLISYKTPWLIINMTAPMALLAAFYINTIKNKKIKIIITTLSLAYLVIFSINLNFINTWENNSFAYVNTNKEILKLVNEINEDYTPSSKILILSNEYWPLPFYLDGKNVMYLDKAETFNPEEYKEYDTFIVKDSLIKDQDLSKFSHSQSVLREEITLHLLIRK